MGNMLAFWNFNIHPDVNRWGYQFLESYKVINYIAACVAVVGK